MVLHTYGGCIYFRFKFRRYIIQPFCTKAKAFLKFVSLPPLNLFGALLFCIYCLEWINISFHELNTFVCNRMLNVNLWWQSPPGLRKWKVIGHENEWRMKICLNLKANLLFCMIKYKTIFLFKIYCSFSKLQWNISYILRFNATW